MKKLLSFLVAMSMLCSFATVPASAEDNAVNVVTEFKTDNLIVNGGFENDFDGWTVSNPYNLMSVTESFVDDAGAKISAVNGKKTFYVNTPANPEKENVSIGYVEQEIDATANTNYVLNLSWYDAYSTYGSIKVYGDTVSSETCIATVGNLFSGNSWYSSTCAFNSGESEKLIVRMEFVYRKGATKYAIDNITLKAAGNTQTIDFENGYPEDLNIRTTNLAVTTEKAYTGTHSLKFVSGSGYPIANATFALNPERHFAVMFWYYIESGKLGAASKFAHENGWSGYTQSPLRNQTLSATGEWKRAIMTPNDGVTGSLTNKFVELAFQNMAPDTVVYIDNIQCKYYDESVDSITVTGENEEGGVLTADAKAYNYGYNFQDPVSYQWQVSADKKNWTDIAGAMTENYTITAEDSQKYVRVKVSTYNRYSTAITDAYYSKAIQINKFTKAEEFESITTFTSDNIIVNGGFENGFEDWVLDNPKNYISVVESFTDDAGATKSAVNGKKTLYVSSHKESADNYAGSIYQIVDGAANTNYVLNLSWYDLYRTFTNIKVYGDSISEENCVLNGVTHPFSGNGWYSSTATFNSGDHEKLIIKIDFLTGTTGDRMYAIDNITLKAAGNIQTIGFESGYPEDFNIRGTEYAVTTEKAYSGTHSIKLTSGSGFPIATATFALKPERHFAVMFWYYIESGKLGAASKFAHENGWSGYTQNPLASETVSEAGEWKRAILTPADGVTGTLNNTFVELAFQNMATDTVVYIDDIQCKYYDESVDSIKISGENKAGGIFSAEVEAYNHGYNFEDPVTYQWQRSQDKKTWTDIAGATSADYKLTIDDSQKYLRLRVNTSNRYSAAVVDSFYSKAVEVAEITVEDIKAQLLEEIEVLVAGFDANDSAKVMALADALDLANELGCDITAIENYAELETIGLDNFSKVKSAKASKDGNTVTVEIELTAPISASFVAKDNFKVTADRNDVEYTLASVTNGDGKVTSIKMSFNATEEKYCQVYAKYGFVCNFSDVLAIYDIAVEGDIILSNAQGVEISKLTDITDGVVKGSMTLSAQTAQDVMLVQAIYTDAGRLYSSDMKNVNLSAGDVKDYTFTLSVPTDGTLNDSFTFKTFIWKDGEFEPFMNAKNSDSFGKTYGIDALNDPSKPLTVAYIGGSQTQGGYYTTPLTNKIKAARTGEVTAINAGVGGSGTDYGAFRVQNDVVSKNPDVVFVEFTLNDMHTDKTMVRKNVEGVLRQLNSSNHIPVVIFIHIPSENDEMLSASAANYEQLLKNYGLTGINVHSYIKGLVDAGTYTYTDMFQADGVHLNSLSGDLTANYIYDAITGANKATYIKNTANIAPIFENGFVNPTLLDPTVACYDASWQDAEPGDKVMEGYNTPIEQNLFEHYMVTNKENAKMTFSFVGDKLLLEGLRGKDGRKIKYEVTNDDGTVVAIGESGNYIAGYNWYKGSYMLLTGLGAGKHTLTITVLSAEGTGEAFGIGGIWVDEQ